MTENIKTNDCLCVILTGTAPSVLKAESMAVAAQSCPYVVLYTHQEARVMAVFCLPRSSQKWIELPKEQPFILALSDIVTVVTDKLQADAACQEQAVDALGDGCEDCPEHAECRGCVASLFYHAAE